MSYEKVELFHLFLAHLVIQGETYILSHMAMEFVKVLVAREVVDLA